MAEFQVTVTIENLAPENGIFLTPFWVGFHDGEFDTYDFLRPVSSGLEQLVEDGDASGLSAEFELSGTGTVEGTIAGDEGIAGVIDPGEVVTATFTLDSDAPSSRYFNFVSMLIPSNDAFIGNRNHRDYQIFNNQGKFLGLDLTVSGSEVADAGTEVNDELETNTAFFAQADPNTGVDENGIVRQHPGLIDGGRILSEDGTSPNAPAAFTNADFTANNYDIARITISSDDGVLDLEDDFDTPIYRFQNTGVRGTYLYVGEQERTNILNNFPNFVEEGVAFRVASEPDDGLIPLYRFQSVTNPGTYIYVGEDERTSINNNSNQSFTEEGLAFYVYGVGANQGAAFTRFQNSDVPGTYLYATGTEATEISSNFSNFVNEGVAFEVEI